MSHYLKIIGVCIYIIFLQVVGNIAFNQEIQIDTSQIMESKKNELAKLDLKLKTFEKSITGIDTMRQLNNLKLSKILWDVLKKDIKNTHGSLSLGYSYGLNTIFSDSSRAIGSIFGINGEMTTSLIGVPVNLSFNYSTLKVPLGANNYFRLSFDKDRFLKQKKAELENKLASLSHTKDKFLQEKGKLSATQGYLETYLKTMENQLKAHISDSLMKIKRLSKDLDSSSINQGWSDSLSNVKDNYFEKFDSLSVQANSTYQEYQEKYEKAKKMYERVILLRKKIDEIIEKYNGLTTKVEEAQKKLDFNGFTDNSKNKLEKTNFINSIQKLDLGLNYPSTTGLSDQSVAIKGIGTEFQIKDYYLSVSSGLTLNNVMLSTDAITNELNYKQNVFNQFDFQQVLNNGILSVLKTGWGKPEATHIYFGTNYLTNTRILNQTSALDEYRPALSLEVEAAYIPTFYKGGKLELVYGKTSVNDIPENLSINKNVFKSLFSSAKSNYYLAKYTQNVPKIRSHFSLDYRSIDPLTNTTVFGMLQPGNRRISFESRHKIKSYFKFGSNLKREESLGSENRLLLHTIGGNLNGSYKSYLSYFLMVNYVNYVISGKDIYFSKTTRNGNSYLFGGNVTGNYKIRDRKLATNISYNDYLIADTSQMNQYRQMGIKQMMMNNNWNIALGYNYFFKKTEDIHLGTHVLEAEGSYFMSKMKIGLNFSIALSEAQKTSYGFKINLDREITKYLSLSVIAERFIQGDFHRNFYPDLYHQFPYLFTFNTFFKF